MRKIALLLGMALITLNSCNKKYTVIIEEGGEENEYEIRSGNDTLAYIEAYKKFIIEIKVAKDKEKAFGGEQKIPEGFRLITEDGRDITNVEFSSRKLQEEKISKSINEQENVFSFTMSDKKKTVDSVAISELSPFFKVEKDEFSPEGNTFTSPKSMPKYVDVNWIGLYITENNSGYVGLRIKIQYTAEDWLFIRKVIFNIDGNPITFVPNKMRRDNAGGRIWEWCDELITDYDSMLITMLEEAKEVKVKFVGDDYYKIRTLKNKELTDIHRTIKLYKAKGGEIQK